MGIRLPEVLRRRLFMSTFHFLGDAFKLLRGQSRTSSNCNTRKWIISCGTSKSKSTKSNSEKEKIFNDPIHGSMELHPLCIKIIDTPQFQRMRFIKQLGFIYFVYPGASHNRFEHCIGACHLAGEFARTLQRRQPELNITDEDVLCVEIAALCHDLGHGPFSHIWEKFFMSKAWPEKKWEHETGSVMMFDYLIEANKLERDFEEFHIRQQDRTFIKEQIMGSKCGKDWTLEGRDKDKSFLYEIVANKKNGIDVDKWDYFARDCHMLGMKNSFDHRRLMKTARVLDVDGQLQICFRDKEAVNLYDMFHVRQTLHRRAYQHKVSNIIERMSADALVKANDHLWFEGKNGKLLKMSEAVDDMKAFSNMTDSIFYQILQDSRPELNESRQILENIMSRRLYKYIGHTLPENGIAFTEENLSEFKKEIASSAPNSQLCVDDFVLHLFCVDYGMKDKNPIDNVCFYKKENCNQPVQLSKYEVSRFLPEMFVEQEIRVFCKRSDSESLNLARQCFQKWCERRQPLAKSQH